MIGLPTETMWILKCIADTAHSIVDTYYSIDRKERKGRVE